MTKQNNGIEARGKTIRIHFSYQGERCRETLKLDPTKANLKYANLLRSEILLKIQRNEFNYADYFPSSKNISKFGKVYTNKKYRCRELLEKLLKDYEMMATNLKMSPSTFQGYKKSINSLLLPYFGNYFIHEVTPIIVREWIEGINVTAKTIRNTLTPLRAIFDDAMNDQIIDSSPLNKLALTKLLKVNAIKSTYEVNPFNLEEKKLIINASPPGNIRNLLQFCFHSGLRTSELIALSWEDIDLKKGIIYISKAKVCGIVKGTKTKSGMRKIKLLPEALEALNNQFEVSGKFNEEVFLNPNTNKSWSHSNKIWEAWQKVFLKCKVKYRNPYQMRHTFASTLLSAGENPLKVAQLMGHTDTSMIFKVYGKWIPEQDN